MSDENKSAPAAEPAEAASGRSPENAGGKIFVVGIGASAGGLEAIGELIRHLPVDGMAFIVVQHLAPDHESLLTQLLARSSRMQVVTAADGMPLEANHVYVIPPKVDLAVLRGVIHVMAPSKRRGPHLPIDYLFRSLAEDGLRDHLEGVFASASLLRGYEVRIRSADGGEHIAQVGVSLIPASTEVPLLLMSIEPPGQASRGFDV